MALGAPELGAACLKKYLTAADGLEFSHLMHRDETIRILELRPKRRSLLSILNSTEAADVTVLLPGGRELRCHRAVLLARSGYFESLFSRWGDSDIADLQGVRFEAETMARVLRFYTDSLELTRAHTAEQTGEVLAALSAASYLQIGSLEMLCEQLLSKHLNMELAPKMWHVANDLGLEQLCEDTVRFVQAHFRDLASGTEDADKLLAEIPEELMFQALHPGRIKAEARPVVDCVRKWSELRCLKVDAFLPPNTLLTESWKQQVLQASWSTLPPMPGGMV